MGMTAVPMLLDDLQEAIKDLLEAQAILYAMERTEDCGDIGEALKSVIKVKMRHMGESA